MSQEVVTRRMISVLVWLLVCTPSAFPASVKASKQKQSTTSSHSTKKPTSSKATASSSTSARKATRPRTVTVVRDTPLRSGEIKEVEERLQELSYWTGPIDGILDETSRSALIAFQKVTGRTRNGKLNRAERSAVMRSERPVALENGPAHVEVDLQRQVLFMVDEDGVVTRTLPVSTGSGKDFYAEGFERTAVTPPGRFKVQGKIAGWKKSALGRLYYPNYIIGGIAIHGYSSIPAKPASHGCIRIPMFAAQTFFKGVPVGTLVLVHLGATPDESAGSASDRNR
jgi:lipoprotein-anchoring transpeptidase ErfK/SrfK